MKLVDYCLKSDRHFFEERPLLLDVADQIEDWYFNPDQKVLNLSMPTRMGKTRLATLFSAWIFTRFPTKRILRSSFSAELAEQTSIQTKQTYLSFIEKLKQDIPQILIPQIIGTRSRWSIGNQSQPNMIATGYEGTITGFGADIGIFDDMSKNIKTAKSAAFDSDLNGFLESVVYGRLENERKIMNVGTRWTQNDWFTKFNPDVEIIIPAMTDEVVSVCENWKSTPELLSEKEKVSEFIWSAQYQQRPTVSGRIRLLENWKPKFSDVSEFQKQFITIDPSLLDGNDYFVMCHFGKKDGQLYLIDMFAETKTDFQNVVNWIRSKTFYCAFIEKNGYGKTVLNRLLNEYNVRSVVGFSTTSDKYTRTALEVENIENYLHVVPGCNHVEKLQRQANEFPNGVNDDILDCVVMGFERWMVI